MENSESRYGVSLFSILDSPSSDSISAFSAASAVQPLRGSIRLQRLQIRQQARQVARGELGDQSLGHNGEVAFAAGFDVGFFEHDGGAGGVAQLDLVAGLAGDEAVD